MKRTVLLLLLASGIILGPCSAQDHLGDDYMLYKGTYWTVDTSWRAGQMTHSMYEDVAQACKPYSDRVAFPSSDYSFKTDKTRLLGMVFRVDRILDEKGVEVLKPSFLTRPIIELVDTTTLKKFYFKYDRKYSHGFAWHVSGLVITADAVCSSIIKVKDDFEDLVRISSPPLQPVQFIKVVKDNVVTYYLRLKTRGLVVSVTEKSAKVLFMDQTKWSNPVDVDVEAEKAGYEYTAFIRLTQEELEMFALKEIDKFRLGSTFDEDLSPIDGQRMRAYAECILHVTP